MGSQGAAGLDAARPLKFVVAGSSSRPIPRRRFREGTNGTTIFRGCGGVFELKQQSFGGYRSSCVRG
jgi:hypothetical protein